MHSFFDACSRVAACLRPAVLPAILLATVAAMLPVGANAHPLGRLAINHFVRVETGVERAELRYVVDLAEVPTFQETITADTDQDGALSDAERRAYLERITPEYLAGVKLAADGVPVNLKLDRKSIDWLPGEAGLKILRIVFELSGEWQATGTAPRLRVESDSLADRTGWREIVVMPMSGVSIFNSTAFGNSVTDELRAYPEDSLQAPLNERSAEWSATRGALPTDAKPLTLRDGKPVIVARDRFAELISVPKLTPSVMLFGLLLAFVLGGAHALTPGHGKAVAGAYLIGSRGTPKHAAFLGLTVTIAHTFTVYFFGLLTLFASRYFSPEKLYPVLTFISGALIVTIGVGMFSKRLRGLLDSSEHIHDHHHGHSHSGHGHDHRHSHLPPERVTWRSLLALGISGGIIPCPSAWLLMLGAVTLQRVGYGMVLITAFSFGLASVLTAVGLAFVYGEKLMERIPRANRWLRLLPTISALIVAAVGLAICYQALRQAGINPADWWHVELEDAKPTTPMAILGLGLVIGLRHAIEADHLAAVSTIVSERKNVFSSMLIGGLWGVGHTVSLLIAGIAVILLKLQIGKYERPLEFCVALMLIGLGMNVLIKLARGGKLHFHEHTHGGHQHVHPHLHDGKTEPEPHTHHGFKLGIRPLIIGMVHGLAGSAALMLAVLTTITSTALAFTYILIFGAGSIGGMMIMSLILSLPLHFTVVSFARTNFAVRALAGVFSLGFGLFMAYKIGYVEGLFR